MTAAQSLRGSRRGAPRMHFGCNNVGQVGDGTTVMRTSPVKVKDLSGVVAIAGGGWFSLADPLFGQRQSHALGGNGYDGIVAHAAGSAAKASAHAREQKKNVRPRKGR